MIIADTSVWIDYFNGEDNPLTEKLDSGLEQGLIAIGDLILLEILQGFRSDKDYNIAKTHLNTLELYPMLNHRLAIKAADNYRFLREQGYTIRKTADIIIATFCIENKFSLLFSDRDFLPFVQYLHLQQA